jgi:uncharacterized protein (TIGR04255 family)
VQSITLKPDTVDRSTERVPEWWYWHKDRNKRLTISRYALFSEYLKYDHFQQLLGDFLPVLGSLSTEYAPLQIKQLGLRYIDNFTFENGYPLHWSDYFDERLLTDLELADDKKAVSRSLHWLELNYGEMGLRFQFGMPNPDYPAPIRRRHFVLDTDAVQRQQLWQ